MIKPRHDYVLVRPEKDVKTAGGLFIPEGARQMSLLKGTVLASGPGTTLQTGEVVPTGLQPGDTVYYPQHTAIEIDQGLVFIRSGEALAIEIG